MTSSNDEDKNRLPVLIAGAGPCGLVAALVLQQQGVPFQIIERAERDRLVSDVGSGFDLAPTAIDILKNRLQLPVDTVLNSYAGMRFQTMDDTIVREAHLSELKIPFEFSSVTRSGLQTLLLNALLKKEPAKQAEEQKILRCGVQVTDYHVNSNGSVTVTLSDGTSVIGSVLLGCDGIHSAVRRHMFRHVDDELHFCNTNCWWGKINMTPELERAVDKTQAFKDEGTSFVWMLGSHRYPGSFMGAPLGKQFMWAFFLKSSTPPIKSNDLRRRGGVTLDEQKKQELQQLIAGRGELINLVVKETTASNITNVGLFDRQDQDLPYSSDKVVLLGDAAHPQSPFMGQGVNMAMSDAYVCATRLAKQPVDAALQAYDSDLRRKGVNEVVNQARSYTNLCVSQSRFKCWLFRAGLRWVPLSWTTREMLSGDRSNCDFVRQLDSESERPPEEHASK